MFLCYHQRFLKIKIKSLIAEARIIKEQEKKAGPNLRDRLRHHRITVVRLEARASFLAYAYLRGRTLASVEGTSGVTNLAAYERALRIVKKFGTTTAERGFDKWAVGHFVVPAF